ncbi:MAG: PAS domain-containing protein [Oligoflexia bacterium]|nr:PAS domain-containing protein [Oligoflexia bacterium]
MEESNNFEEEVKNDQENYRMLVENNNAGIFQSTVAGKFLYVNNELVKMVGCKSTDELLSMSVESLYANPVERIRVAKELKDKGEVKDIVFEGIKKDGTKGWVSLTAKVQMDIKGLPKKIFGIVVDISERKKAEEDFIILTQRLKLATNAAKLGVWDLDLVNNILIWDDRMLEIYGFTRENFHGGIEFWQKCLHPADREMVIKASHDSLIEDKNWDITFRILRPEGTVRHIKAEGKVVRNFEGKAVRMIGINRDVTEEVNMQSQLMFTERLVSIGTLASGVAHEINNPLAIIMGNIELIEDDCKSMLDNCQIMMMEKIKNATKRIVDIVNGLRNYVRADTEQISNIEVHQCINRTLHIVEEIYKKENIKLEYNLSAKDSFIKANAGKLEQVVLNVVSNARDALIIKKSPSEKCIKVVTYNKDHNLIIEIKDNGIGIPKQIISKIFDPFFTTKPIGQGTGLGLSICHAIVNSFAGTINLESDGDVGTILKMTFPIA